MEFSTLLKSLNTLPKKQAEHPSGLISLTCEQNTRQSTLTRLHLSLFTSHIAAWIFAALLALMLPMQAEALTWSPPTGPNAGAINAIVINPTTPSTLYTGTSLGGVFKSTDSGATWLAVNTGLTDPIGTPINFVASLALNPVTPSTLYAATTGGLFRSMDSGANWAAVNIGLANLSKIITNLAINPTTPSTLYVAPFGGGVLKSTDSGATWIAVNTGVTNLSINSLVIDPATPSTIYAGTRGGLFKSMDSGANWAAVNTGLTNMLITGLAIDPATPSTLYVGAFGVGGGVFKSIDSGANWAAVNTGITNLNILDIEINPITPSILYTTTNGGGVFKSTDSGATWVAVNTGIANLNVQGLVINPITPSILYAGTSAGVQQGFDAAGGTPTIALSLNGAAFNSTTNKTLTLTETTAASIPASNADLYIALKLPDGTLLVMQPGGSFSSTAITPRAANISVPNFTGAIFSFTFTGAEPIGTYTWFAALTQPGTFNVIGTLTSAPFTFVP